MLKAKKGLQDQFRKKRLEVIQTLGTYVPAPVPSDLVVPVPSTLVPLPSGLVAVPTVTVPNYMKPIPLSTDKPNVLCMFQIVNNGAQPFLLFLMKTEDEKVTFFSGQKTPKASVKYMRQLFPAADIAYVGYYSTEERHILILQYVAKAETEVKAEHIWATTHEIMNLKQVWTYSIDPYISQFFFNNSTLLILNHSDSWLEYETPVVGYYRTDTQLSDIRPTIVVETLGKYYYFSQAPDTLHTQSAHTQSVHTKSVHTQSILIRSVIFLKQTGLSSDGPSAKYDSYIIHREGLYAVRDYNQHYQISSHS